MPNYAIVVHEPRRVRCQLIEIPEDSGEADQPLAPLVQVTLPVASVPIGCSQARDIGVLLAAWTYSGIDSPLERAGASAGVDGSLGCGEDCVGGGAGLSGCELLRAGRG